MTDDVSGDHRALVKVLELSAHKSYVFFVEDLAEDAAVSPRVCAPMHPNWLTRLLFDNVGLFTGPTLHTLQPSMKPLWRMCMCMRKAALMQPLLLEWVAADSRKTPKQPSVGRIHTTTAAPRQPLLLEWPDADSDKTPKQPEEDSTSGKTSPESSKEPAKAPRTSTLNPWAAPFVPKSFSKKQPGISQHPEKLQKKVTAKVLLTPPPNGPYNRPQKNAADLQNPDR
ncbi:hypothetical protein WJX73_009195 [Symbiochloris irregularis]|uniref:Uncharacterized protein n=1 Tax=Symbiochloris irregularis TaxID=706552 RepID=A0AAW1NLQ1_9CHLO